MLLIIGDVHIKKSGDFAYDYEYLQILKNFAKEKNIKRILFLGDIFDIANASINMVQNFYKIIELFEDFQIDIIVGNHDLLSKDIKDNAYNKLFLPKNVRIFDSIFIENNYIYLPYNFNLKSEIKKIKDYIKTSKFSKIFIFSHNDIAELYGNINIHAISFFDEFSDIIDKEIYLISGHIHKTMFLSKNNIKIYCAGCYLNKSYSDKNVYNVIFTLENNEIEVYKTYYNDIYLTVEIKNENDIKEFLSNISIYPNIKYVKFIIPVDKIELIELSDIIYNINLKTLNIIDFKIEFKYSLNVNNSTNIFDEIYDFTTEFTENEVEENIFNEYLEHIKIDKETFDKLNTLIEKYAVK